MSFPRFTPSVESEFYHPCQRCGKAIDRKWTSCFICRNRPTPSAEAKSLPPPRERKIRNHRGRRTPNISTLN